MHWGYLEEFYLGQYSHQGCIHKRQPTDLLCHYLVIQSWVMNQLLQFISSVFLFCLFSIILEVFVVPVTIGI